MASTVAPVAALVFNAFVWGISWWPFRELQSQGLHPLWATALIYLFCLSCVLVTRRGAVAGFLREPRLWLLVAACGLTNVGFNWGVTVGDVVRVVLLFYLMPAWSVLLAWPLLGERPTIAALLRLVLALAGGFSFALTNILLRKLRDVPTESRVLAMFGGGAITAAAAGFIGVAHGAVPMVPIPQAGWTLLAIALGVSFLASNLALQYGASRLAAHTTALVMLSEVVFASLSAVLLGAGELTPRVLVGGALILAAAAWSAWPSKSAAMVGAQSAS